MKNIKRSDIFRDVAETKILEPIDVGNTFGDNDNLINPNYNDKRKVKRRLKRDAAFSKARAKVDKISEERAFRLESEFDV